MESRYQLIVHSPGPAWTDGAPFNDQPGVGEHAAYLRSLFERGVLLMAGPFLDHQGGGQVVLVDVSLEEAEKIAAEDPGVVAGLLEWKVRPWFVAMDKSQG